MITVKKYALLVAGIAIGAIAGFGYYYWVGCQSGSCPITSQPVTSTLYGAVLGALLVNVFNKK
jgi:hypothetical protein